MLDRTVSAVTPLMGHPLDIRTRRTRRVNSIKLAHIDEGWRLVHGAGGYFVHGADAFPVHAFAADDELGAFCVRPVPTTKGSGLFLA